MRGGAKVRRNSAGESQPESKSKPDERPPGQFVTDELASDCSRFLEEVKDVVRRRAEAGVSRNR